MDTLYARYKASPDSVEPSWRSFFTELEGISGGPSWGNAAWPPATTDDLTAALDPTQMESAAKPSKAAKPATAAPATALAPSQEQIIRAAGDAIRAQLLIRTYRVRGHLAANLDPLGLIRPEMPADLTTEYHGFSDADIDRPVYLGGTLGLQWATIRQVVDILRANYCGNFGLEYMHIADVEERRFLQDRMEGHDKAIDFTPQGKKAILNKVIEAEQWEKFLGRKYVGTKRFGLDGGESMIPALESVIKYGGQYGIREIVFGMAHRGRLNVLANVLAKPLRVIFHEFSGGSANPEDVGGSGDVKYHLGTSTDREFDGVKVHLSLVANPSHLEAADPVVLGKTRAIQTVAGDLKEHTGSLPVLIHGDAAMAGQGIVWECFGFSGIRGYNTGGCVHFIINNQIGFTTSPQFARSSPYSSDVARRACRRRFSTSTATIRKRSPSRPRWRSSYRQRFHRDVVIDMWCYRRFGHNEGDEPSFTQPLMYDRIRQHPPVSAVYGEAPDRPGRRRPAVDRARTRQSIHDAARRGVRGRGRVQAEQGGLVRGALVGAARRPPIAETARRNVETGVRTQAVRRAWPNADHRARRAGGIHKTLARVLAMPSARCSGRARDSIGPTGEALAFGALLSEGHGVRLSGQDSGRGTFSQRHALWVDQTDGHKYVPLATVEHGRFEVLDSPLSANMACSASNTAMRSPTPRLCYCGKRSSAISPTARRS